MLFSTLIFVFLPSFSSDRIGNRVKHGPQSSVPEGMFDDRVDLVVWGHEHDCRIEPEPVARKEYYITQPGSSVATSLAHGEAIPKYVIVHTY
jgi:double-strand break repair protein MRE11